MFQNAADITILCLIFLTVLLLKVVVKLHLPDPLTKLQGVWHCGAQENDADMVGKHNQNLLPHNASLKKQKKGRTKEKRRGKWLFMIF